MEQNLLEKKVNKLEGIIRQLVYLLQASPAIPQHASENLLKMMDAKEVKDESTTNTIIKKDSVG